MERVQKIIASSGYCSRRKAEELIEKRLVKINGKVAKLGDKATFSDSILINNKPITKKEEHVYYLLNKPPKTITSVTDPRDRKTVCDIVDVPERVFPVGRLDWDTTGVLLLTNDGDLTHKLTHPSFEIKRVYRARLNESLSDEELKFLNGNDVIVNDKKTMQVVTRVDAKSYAITLHVGTYHHVKKLFETVNKDVIKLTRIEYAGINIIDLPKGKFRKLKPKEVQWLKKLTSGN